MHCAASSAVLAVPAIARCCRGASHPSLRACAALQAKRFSKASQSSFRGAFTSPGAREAFSADTGAQGGPPLPLQRVTNKDLEAWANGSAVKGHAYTRASTEPYTVSATRHFGSGTESPAGWAAHFLSTSGMKSGGSPNQDAYSFTTLHHGWILCIACDGHGEHGEVIAERVSRVLPLFFSANLAEGQGTEEALRRAFESSQTDLERSFSSMQVFSGATVALCCMQEAAETVWCAHVGDSRIVLGDMETGRPVYATAEHKAHHPDEYSRLEAAGAQVVQKRYDDGEVVSRIFIPKTGVPGLAMSRSLGDGCLKKYGVSAEPEICEITGQWNACRLPSLMLASDGLWDTVSIEEAVSAMSARYRAGRDLKSGLENLTRRSQRRWIEVEGDYCDDVTVCFIAPEAKAAPDSTGAA
mmetsp:Transcript_45848/g.102782  ORF Transcript_45848/g.102782 Transcript_45848/m.102782 type:complete len:413 (+) Transcript_45848:18-1256(+)